MNGNEAILYWNNQPIACLTSNSISEALSFITTCKTTRIGALSFIPQANSYTISFEGVFSPTDAMSWDTLATICRNMQKGNWTISGVQDEGFGYLENLEITATSGENILFSGSILGVGEITRGGVQYVWYQNVDTYVDNSGNYVFVQ